ncbi:MAG: glycosyltransferase family 2 protein [Dehalococcoidia bacterium]
MTARPDFAVAAVIVNWHSPGQVISLVESLAAGRRRGLRSKFLGSRRRPPEPGPVRWSQPPASGRASRVTAVVVVWNTPQLAIQTIDSLAPVFERGLRIVLVDNGSIDDTVAEVRAHLERSAWAEFVTVLESGENLGFSGGVNLGTGHALAQEPAPDFVWTLNPDAVVSPETLDELVAVAHESSEPIVAPAGMIGRHRGLNAWPRAFFLPPRMYYRPNDPGRRWWPAALYGGSCALFDVTLIRQLIAENGHFLDPDLFLDWDEWDCALRARRFGAGVVLAREAAEYHDADGRTLGRTPIAAARQYYQSRNAIIVARRYMPAWQFWPALPVHLGRDISWFARLRISGRKPNVRAYLSGAIDGLRGKTGRWKHHPTTPTAKR